MKKMLVWLMVVCLLLTSLAIGLAVSAAANDDYIHEDEGGFSTDSSSSSSSNSTSSSDYIHEDDGTFTPDPSTSQSTPIVTPAGKDVNIATLDEVNVTITDKKGTAVFDKARGSVRFPDHLDQPVGLTFETAGLLADRYIVSFTAEMHGGWESNGVQISWGNNASVKLIKAHAKGGQIIIGDQTVDYNGIRDALIAGTADVLAHVYPNADDATKSDVDIYLGDAKIATVQAATLSDTITIGSVCGAWGDMLEMTDIKIMNNTDLVPDEDNDGPLTDGVIVDGVDTSKKGTGQDIVILAPGDAKNPSENFADINKMNLPNGVTLANGVVTLKGGVDLTFDLSGIKATDDYIISFKTQSLSWYPHEYMNITFGQSGFSKHVWTFKGNAKPNGDSDTKNEFSGVNGGATTKNIMKIPNNTLHETKYVIYVTTSPETGKRRIFFFANNKPLVEVDADGNEKPLVIEDQDVLNPCLTFRSFAGSDQYQLKDISAYIAQAPKFKEALIDKEYTTSPVPNAGAKNWAEIDKAVLVGAGEVTADGKIIAPGGVAPASSVTIPLTGLTKEDSYLISFKTTTCSYDDWQSLTVTIGQEGAKNQKFVLRGPTAYSGMYLNGAETRIKAMAAKGSLTKIDILVSKSVETEKRRVVVFQDGKVCVMYNAPGTAYETKLADLLDPVLTFAGGKNATFEITNLKVYKMDAKGNFVPTITAQPKHTYAKLGETAKTTVKATGDGLKYQWYIKNNGATKYSKSSITSNTYSVKMSDAVHNRRVYCVITDQYGNKVQTQTVILRRQASVTTQPQNTYTKLGATAKTTVSAVGDGLKYQWYVKNAGATKYSKSSVTTATYSVKMSEKVKDRYAYCVVTDQYGKTVKTNTVVFRMTASITTQPKHTYVKLGATAKTSVSVLGDGLKYQWYVKNDGATKYSKSSITSNTYSVKMSDAVHNRRVYCVITDKYGNKVQTETVILRRQATITTQPKSVTVAKNKTAKVTVTAVGDGLTYKWYYKDKGASKFTLTDSFKGNTYSVSMTAARNGRQLYCVVTDKYGKKVQTNTVTIKMG